MTVPTIANSGSELSDEDLVASYIRGDHSAFSALVGRHRRKITRLAQKYSGNSADAEDIVQEALLKASTAAKNFRGDSKVTTWLYTIVRNTGHDYIKISQRHDAISLDHPQFRESDINHTVIRPERRIDNRVLLAAAMQQLREDQRMIVYLADVAGHTLEEVGKITGAPTGTIKSRRNRAYHSLREYLHSQTHSDNYEEQRAEILS